MTYVVSENCIKCKYTDCVEVCPADCFYEGPNFLTIHPEECIDCALCVSECPVDAIYHEDDLPESQSVFLEVNELLANAASFTQIIKRKDALPEADEYADQENKKELLKIENDPDVSEAVFKLLLKNPS